MRFLKQASRIQKAKVAMQLLLHKLLGSYPGGAIWLDRLKVPSGEFIVNLAKEERNGVTKPGQPLHSDSNAMPAAAGSGP